MNRTPAQQLGFFVLLAANQSPNSFTGRITITFDFAAGALKESRIVGLERRIDLQRLNESNKTLDKSETISYIAST